MVFIRIFFFLLILFMHISWICISLILILFAITLSRTTLSRCSTNYTLLCTAYHTFLRVWVCVSIFMCMWTMFAQNVSHTQQQHWPSPNCRLCTLNSTYMQSIPTNTTFHRVNNMHTLFIYFFCSFHFISHFLYSMCVNWHQAKCELVGKWENACVFCSFLRTLFMFYIFTDTLTFCLRFFFEILSQSSCSVG